MAKILQPPTSGSIGGITHSHNRGGQYLRSRRVPVNSAGNGRKGVIRAAFGAASSAWSALTAMVQASWTSFAAQHPYVDSLGQSVILTGHQMYVAVNSQLINCGKAQSSVIPVSTSVFAAGFTAFTAEHAGAISITPTGAGAATDFLLISASAPQSGGVGSCKTFCQIMSVAGNVVAATAITTQYKAQFGDIVAGTRIFYKLTPVNQYGIAGAPNIGFITVG